MSLLAFLGAARIAEIVAQIPDNRLNPSGGRWDERVPSRDGDTGDILGRDAAVPLAADILARDGRSRDVQEPSIVLEVQKAAKINSSIRLTESDVELLHRLVRTGGADRVDRAALISRLARMIERRRQSVAITRGLLKAGMALGDFSYARLGVKTGGSIDFGMPSTLKIVPATFWYGAGGAANLAATPISDLTAADVASDILGGAPYDSIELSQVAYNAMVSTTEYKNAATGRIAVYNTASLPPVGTADSYALAGTVLNRKISITENRYQYQDETGATLTGRYVPAHMPILYRSTDVARNLNWEWVNTPVIQSSVAALGGSDAFGGEVVRGPVEYVSYDAHEFTWVRFHCIQEGAPVRRDRTVTARFRVASSESGA